MVTPMDLANATSSSLTDTSIKSVADQEKQKRLESLTYLKAHFDLLAVTLLVTYLGYSLYKMNKNNK
jgi:hypothetical protein